MDLFYLSILCDIYLFKFTRILPGSVDSFAEFISVV
jgi:hypothetical protein